MQKHGLNFEPLTFELRYLEFLASLWRKILLQQKQWTTTGLQMS